MATDETRMKHGLEVGNVVLLKCFNGYKSWLLISLE
jgi:hypothetical protein